MARIYVGLSGGVDSATSAALLKQQGHDVTGVFIKIWSPEFLECTWREDRLDAMRAAVTLGIPFKEVDLSEEYRATVIDSMLRDYAAGITPNPDVLCNRSIKFGSFAEWAFENGADMIATGHYARIEKHGEDYSLMRGKDPNKDQSYFLYLLKETDLERIVFPIGELAKTEVREKAREFGLTVAHKPDSQGLCFVGDVSMREFLKRFMHVENGPVIDEAGAVIGEHEGAALYTLGERHGFRIFGAHEMQGPFYVVSTDIKENVVRVSKRREESLRQKAIIQNVHWIGSSPEFPSDIDAVARYRALPLRGRLTKENNSLMATFSQPELLSPGQSLVFYDGEKILGGGIMT